jgi:predicted lysophospholipase L1 biosynthesis ABC-type transport system permease subunit
MVNNKGENKMSKKINIGVGSRVNFMDRGQRFQGEVVSLDKSDFDVIDFVNIKVTHWMPESRDVFKKKAVPTIWIVSVYDHTLEVL